MSKVLIEIIDKNLFANHDSIKNRFVKRTLKLCWIIAIFLSISGLVYYIQQAYIKSQISPDISTTVKLVPSREIPLPAITICYPHLPKELLLSMHPQEYIEKVKQEQIKSNLSINEQNMMTVAVQTCCPNENIKIIQKMCANKNETDVFKLLFDAKYSQNLNFCAFRDYYSETQCDRILTKSLSDFGFCDTFNTQGYNAIFNDGVLSSDFDFYKYSTLARFPLIISPKFNEQVQLNDTINWTLNEGYKTNEDELLPVRAMKKNNFLIDMTPKDNSWLCRNNGVGNKIFFHLPSEIPTTFSERVLLPYTHDMKISISATLVTTSPGMKYYSPKNRRCYYEGEKKLKFFKTYTKNLCDFECLTNYTLKQCGCVKFSMPRIEGTKVCDLAELECMNKAIDMWPNVDNKDPLTDGSATCDCLESCISLQYKAIKERSYQMSINNVRTILKVSFDKHSIEEHTNYIAYTIQNFVADCGGLVGLFLGFSLLSIVELICNFVVFCVNLKQDKRKNVISNNS